MTITFELKCAVWGIAIDYMTWIDR